MLRRLLVAPVALLALAVGSLAPSGAFASEGCPNEALRVEQRSTFLADCRAYEMVSPPDKDGTDVLLTTERTRVAEDGDAVGFAALGGFAETLGISVAADYLSVRSQSANPGNNGWSTHGISPVQRALSFGDVIAGQEPLYVGPYSNDLDTGVFFAASPLTEAPMVSAVPNLYRRSGLLAGATGTSQLLTACSLCEATDSPLAPLTGDLPSMTRGRPMFAGASPDFEHIIFESSLNLTSDAPPPPELCNRTERPFSLACPMRLYEWDHGITRLAGILPDNKPADASFAGEGAIQGYATPGVVSDGADGHTRIFFTQPTDSSGRTVSEAEGRSLLLISSRSTGGNLFMRVDGSSTEQLNVSERAPAEQFPPDAFAPARFVDSSADGTRAFFITTQALTNDAPLDGQSKLYMYDASKPGSDTHNLTLLSRDDEPSDGTGDVRGAIGPSRDGHYFYFVAAGELVKGGPSGGTWIYLWHDGQITRVAPAPSSGGKPLKELLETDVFPWNFPPQQARVSPDGRTLLFGSISGEGLTGYNHGECTDNAEVGCRELYVYHADTNRLECASCNPTGAPAVGYATVYLGQNTIGGTRTDFTRTKPLADDGSRVFFSSPDPLVPQDTNGRYDAYEYDTATKTVSLLTSGKGVSDSYFINASPSGSDAFVLTRDRLVGWDTDESYDLYDMRVGGGFPEPLPSSPPCAAGTCQPATGSFGPALTALASVSFGGTGNLLPHRNAVKRWPIRRLRHALRVCGSRRNRQSRIRCEAAVRRRFGKHANKSRRAGR